VGGIFVKCTKVLTKLAIPAWRNMGHKIEEAERIVGQDVGRTGLHLKILVSYPYS
jgi:hypothetical protein